MKRAAANTSPAPVGSTSMPGTGGISVAGSPARRSTAPWRPRVTATRGASSPPPSGNSVSESDRKSRPASLPSARADQWVETRPAASQRRIRPWGAAPARAPGPRGRGRAPVPPSSSATGAYSTADPGGSPATARRISDCGMTAARLSMVCCRDPCDRYRLRNRVRFRERIRSSVIPSSASRYGNAASTAVRIAAGTPKRCATSPAKAAAPPSRGPSGVRSSVRCPTTSSRGW